MQIPSPLADFFARLFTQRLPRLVLRPILISALLATAQIATAATWNSTAGSSWDNTTSTGWNGAYPDGVDAVATIQTNITAAQVMNLNVNTSLGTLQFGDSTGTSAWSIQDTGAAGTVLTFNVGIDNASLTSSGGSNIISVPISLADSLNLTTNSNLTLSGAISEISGAAGLTKTGAGSLTLSGAGANTYTGTTTVNAGLLHLNKTSGTNAIGGNLILNGGSLSYNGTNKSNQIADGATVTVAGGTFDATSNNSSTSETIASLAVNSGTFSLGNTGTTDGNQFAVTGTTTLSGGVFTLRHSGFNNAANQLTTTNLTINGGTNTLSNNNGAGAVRLVVNGTTTINQPASGALTALSLNNTATNLGSAISLDTNGDLIFNGQAGNANSVSIALTSTGNRLPTIRLGAANRVWTINDGGAPVDLVVAPVVSGTSVGLTKAGAGTLQFDNANIYTGATILAAGVFLDNAAVAASSQTGTRASNDITGLTSTTGLKIGQPVSGAGIPAGTVIAGIVSGTAIRITQSSTSGTGTINFGNAGGVPGGLETTGGLSNLQFNGGVLGLGSRSFSRGLGTGVSQVQFSGDGGFAAFGTDRSVNLGGAGGGVTWAAGSFVPNGNKLILGATNADKTVDFQNPINLAGAVRTVQVDDGSAPADAILSGALTNGGLAKTGSGTLQLKAVNPYAGVTTISAGTMALSGSGSIPNSSMILVGATSGQSSATFDVSAISGFQLASGQTLAGHGTVIGAVTALGGSIVSPGNSPGVLTIQDGDFTLGPAQLSLELSKAGAGSPIAGSDYDQLTIIGSGTALDGSSKLDLSGGDLALTIGGGVQLGDIFYLVSNSGTDAIVGTFSSLNGISATLSEGTIFTETVSSQQFMLTYQANWSGIPASSTFTGGNDLALMAVPEPSAATALLVGFGVLLLARARTPLLRE